jgi:hypothetical protein
MFGFLLTVFLYNFDSYYLWLVAKDYDGARTIAIYFVPAVLAVYWLS